MKKIVKAIRQDQKDVYTCGCKYKANQGVILIELIIVTTIGLLILSILTEMYLSNQKSLTLQTALYNIQNNAKSATSILTSEIHKAGIIGCAKLSNDFPIISYQEFSLTPKNKLIGSDADFIIRYAEFPNNYLISDMQDNATIATNQDIKFTEGEILLISNCKHAEIFKAGKISFKNGTQKIRTENPLHHKYDKFSEVSKFIVNKFFIKKTKYFHLDGTPIYSLFVENINHRKTELVMDINQMKVYYTVNNNGIFFDVSANEVTDWSSVVGVGINLELISLPIKKIWHLYSSIQV